MTGLGQGRGSVRGKASAFRAELAEHDTLPGLHDERLVLAVDPRERTGRVVSSGAINTTLGRLAERKLVTATVGQPTAGRAGRPRKYYAVTPAGARALRDSYSTIQAIAGGLISKLTALADKQ